MGFSEFICKVEKGVQDVLGSEVQVTAKTIRKNNGVMLEALSIAGEDGNLFPTIYLNQFFEEYEGGKSLGEVVGQVIDIYKKSGSGVKIEEDFFADYEKIKENIFCKLIHFEKNIQLLEEIPYKKFLNLAIVCYYSYTNDIIGNGTITIYQSHLDRWKISSHMLIEEALKNTRELLGFQCLDMKELVSEMMKEKIKEQFFRYTAEENISEEWMNQILDEMLEDMEMKEDYKPMYVLTNRERFLGAICMVYESILEEIGRAVETDYYILPSSIHELILLPVGEKTRKEQLRSMVNEVNTAEVEAEEILSDSVYYYDREKKEIRLL